MKHAIIISTEVGWESQWLTLDCSDGWAVVGKPCAKPATMATKHIKIVWRFMMDVSSRPESWCYWSLRESQFWSDQTVMFWRPVAAIYANDDQEVLAIFKDVFEIMFAHVRSGWRSRNNFGNVIIFISRAHTVQSGNTGATDLLTWTWRLEWYYRLVIRITGTCR